MNQVIQTFIQGLKGFNDQGSSRRLTAFYFTVILVTALDAAYIYLGITGEFPAPFENIFEAHLIFMGALFAATTTENIYTKKINDKDCPNPADPAAK